MQLLNDIVIFLDIYHSKIPPLCHALVPIRLDGPIKQIKICAEYRDMLPRPRLDLSGTPGLRPIGLSPGSWQTSLGLGSMSRYSAQILICITLFTVLLVSFPLFFRCDDMVTFAQTLDWPLIPDAMAVIWHRSNVYQFVICASVTD